MPLFSLVNKDFSSYDEPDRGTQQISRGNTKRAEGFSQKKRGRGREECTRDRQPEERLCLMGSQVLSFTENDVVHHGRYEKERKGEGMQQACRKWMMAVIQKSDTGVHDNTTGNKDHGRLAKRSEEDSIQTLPLPPRHQDPEW